MVKEGIHHPAASRFGTELFAQSLRRMLKHLDGEKYNPGLDLIRMREQKKWSDQQLITAFEYYKALCKVVLSRYETSGNNIVPFSLTLGDQKLTRDDPLFWAAREEVISVIEEIRQLESEKRKKIRNRGQNN